MKVSDEQAKIIEECIERVEKETSGELVPAMMESSDHYAVAHMRLAVLVSFLTAVVFYLVMPKIDDPIWLLWVQIPGLLLGYGLAFIPGIKRLFLRKSEIDEEVHQRALEVFFANELHSTKNRNGVLIFISAMERRVEMVADRGIDELVDPDTWNRVVDGMTADLKKKEYTTGVCRAIEECGAILKEHFPAVEGENNHNELNNRIVTE